ncbi:mechanosensitive ion channel [Aliarcobacter skirrowii]|uniref:mechanosensitive ion channel family protein n=1 Tax=Aliarcobacter skirrowii TaxID=28200 RepID=UPI0029ABCB9B|nr:mechanosensitive ion channel domain-containing protein [Aliarcobacter skirrowii]MDX4049595.1 mechanosensitive ion channel [Aliarcobacter skirrowii]
MEMSSIENGVEIIKKDFLSFIPQNILDTALEYSWSIFLALLIFFVGKWIVNRVVKVLGKLLRKIDGIDEILVKFLENIAYYSLITAVILAALNKLGITTTSFLAILGAAGLAVGLALKDSLGNFASGVMIIIFKPFRVGDFVTAGGVTGSVSEVGIFNSVFITGDNQRIVVPNSSITSGSITNVNAFDTRRVDLVVRISYDDDIKKAKDLLTNLLTSHEKILVDKDITVAVSELADSSINFVVRAWVNTPDYWEVRFFLIENIKLVFDKEGITIPYPQQDVHHYKKD